MKDNSNIKKAMEYLTKVQTAQSTHINTHMAFGDDNNEHVKLIRKAINRLHFELDRIC
jgi:hypothetical protein